MIKLEKYSLWILLGLTVIACVYAYIQFLLPLDVFLWDEAHHGFYAMEIYSDIKTLNWPSFWEDTNTQALWMPLHSWLVGIFLYVFGFSYTSARLASLFMFFCGSILLYLIGRQLSEDKGWLIGLIAACMYLTSPILLSLSVLNMQEMLGIFVFLGITYFIIRYLLVEAYWKYLLIGFLLSVIYWTKSNYAAQAVLGVAAFQLSILADIWIGRSSKNQITPSNDITIKEKPQIRSDPVTNWLINNALIVIGFLPLFILWWITPPIAKKYELGIKLMLNANIASASFFPEVGYTERIIFYLQSIISSYTFSLWIGLGLLSSVIGSFWLYKDRKIRLISLMFLAALLLASKAMNIQERYIAVCVPLIYLLLSYFIVVIFDKQLKLKLGPIIIIACLASLVIYDVSQLTRYTKEVGNRSILSFIYKGSINRYSPPFFFGVINRPAFTCPMDQLKKYTEFKVAPKSSIRDVLAYFSSSIDSDRSITTMISYAQLSPYVFYWHFKDWKALILTMNDLPMYEKYFWLSDYFIDLKASPDSPYSTDQFEKRWNQYEPVLIRRGDVRLVGKKEFPDLGLTAKIFKREGLIKFR